MIEKYRKGTAPQSFIAEAEIAQIRNLMNQSIDDMHADFKQGIFVDYKSYPTSYGATLNSFGDALMFNNLHEAMHLGTCMSLKKLV